MSNVKIHLREEVLLVAEDLRRHMYHMNRLNDRHCYHEESFGHIQDAMTKVIAVEIHLNGFLTPAQAAVIAERLKDEVIDNGEDVRYQIDLWNRDIIRAWENSEGV